MPDSNIAIETFNYLELQFHYNKITGRDKKSADTTTLRSFIEQLFSGVLLLAILVGIAAVHVVDDDHRKVFNL